jgi:hypothetical protein
MSWLLPHPLPLSREQDVSLSQSSFASPVGLTDGRGRGWERSQIVTQRESLVLYKSFNTLWENVLALLSNNMYEE